MALPGHQPRSSTHAGHPWGKRGYHLPCQILMVFGQAAAIMASFLMTDPLNLLLHRRSTPPALVTIRRLLPQEAVQRLGEGIYDHLFRWTVDQLDNSFFLQMSHQVTLHISVPVLAICCSDTTLIEMMLMTEGVVEVVIPFVLIIVSYALIFYTIMKIPSAVGKRKAFSTCGSHICVVVLFYGAVSWVYFKPNSNNPNSNNTVATVMYTMMIPMLNPYIYSLRNREMKAAMKRTITQRFWYLF
ncbi:UNVERIFIED_CONTAM: hypothetical protein K2H54_047812 [Gekko kuhli]